MARTTPSSRHVGRLQLIGVRCVNCGYDLSGNSQGDHCPECGWPADESLAPYASGADHHAHEASHELIRTLMVLPVPLLPALPASRAALRMIYAWQSSFSEHVMPARKAAMKATLFALVAILLAALNAAAVSIGVWLLTRLLS